MCDSVNANASRPFERLIWAQSFDMFCFSVNLQQELKIQCFFFAPTKFAKPLALLYRFARDDS